MKKNEININGFNFQINPKIFPLLYIVDNQTQNINGRSEISLNYFIKKPEAGIIPENRASSYEYLSAEGKFSYLKWLCTDLSDLPDISYAYVFFKTLDRHIFENSMLVSSIELTQKLTKLVNKYTFNKYISGAIGYVAINLKKPELISDKLLDKCEPSLIVFLKKKLSPDDLIAIASRVGFKNKRYIKGYPNLFKKVLSQVLIDYFDTPVFEFKFSEKQLRKLPQVEIRSYFCSIKIPDILSSETLCEDIKSKLSIAHNQLKPLLKIIRSATK